MAVTHAAGANAAAENAVKRLGSASGTKNHQITIDDDSIDILREMDHYMNRDRLKKIAEKYRTEYANARPFPSHVFDDIFPRRMLLKIMEEHPESALVEGCLPGTTNDACAKGEVKGQLFKSRIDNDKNMGFFTKLFMGYIKSSAFINFLEILSGIQGIIPDPHYTGAGLHFTASGGKLDIHADFNTLLTHKLERRVNLLLFLNDDWKPEYGGHLELWSRDMKRCAQKVAPVRVCTDYFIRIHVRGQSCTKHNFLANLFKQIKSETGQNGSIFHHRFLLPRSSS
jgi:Rps23 Pro-64 3,4-dihydroxylase Tpa1-like proline 4-hydroxylase